MRPLQPRLPDDLAANTIEAEAEGFDPSRHRRNFYTTSSCGVCGKGALEAVAVEASRLGERSGRRRGARRGAAGSGFVKPNRRLPPPGGCTPRASSTTMAGQFYLREDVRAPQRHGQGDRLGVRRHALAAHAPDHVRQRAALLRPSPEGGRCRLSSPRRCRRALRPSRSTSLATVG